jgi:hypothetical protein
MHERRNIDVGDVPTLLHGRHGTKTVTSFAQEHRD